MTQQELTKMAAEERKRYYKEYRERNKEKIAERNRRYWERRALERQRQQAESGDNNDGQQ